MSAYHLSNNIAVGEDVVSDDVITHVEGTVDDDALRDTIFRQQVCLINDRQTIVKW
jgi:hypothetical protein